MLLALGYGTRHLLRITISPILILTHHTAFLTHIAGTSEALIGKSASRCRRKLCCASNSFTFRVQNSPRPSDQTHLGKNAPGWRTKDPLSSSDYPTRIEAGKKFRPRPSRNGRSRRYSLLATNLL